MSDDFDAAKRVELCHHGRKIACPECVDEDPAVEYMLRGEVIGLRAKVREQAEEIERLKRRLAVLDEWEQGHEEAHQRAVDDCPHEEKTWTCCATCHCVEIERRRKAEAELAGRPYAESLATAVKRIEELEDAGIAENHAILKLTDVPREGYTLQEEIRAQLEEAQVELAAERERAKRLEQALAGWLATESLPDCRACAVLDAGLPELALRPAAPEAKESDCTCGEQWPCPLHGGPPAAPEPTHSCQPGNYPDCCDPTSEQPDLPLGHRYVRSMGPAAHSTPCAAILGDGILGHEHRPCGQPESAHRRKP